VTGMTVEPSAMVDCFNHVYRRKIDATSTTCYLDIGASGTRVIIARSGKILFMNSMPFGGDALNAAVADSLKVHPDDARILRQKLTHTQSLETQRASEDPMAAVAGAKPSAPAPVDDHSIASQIEASMQVPLDKMIDELRMCRRYHEATFTSVPIDRIFFGGGEARSRFVCQYIARAMALPAQLGDPMVRLSRSGTLGVESGIDRRQPQPSWAIALGLTMGPAPVAAREPIADAPAEEHAVTAEAATTTDVNTSATKEAA
jgi:type IV pilus assembly protein PilM